MNAFEPVPSRPGPTRLSRRRIAMALAIALGADLLQIAFVPLAWTFVQAAIDVVAMLLVLPVLGFHLLLLPTFVIEFIPGVDMLPTWTGCVIAVIALKKRAESPPPAAPAETAAPPVIDVAEVRKASSNPSADEPCAPPPTQP